MNMTNHTRLDLVEGGSIFKQGEHAQLAFNPRDFSGKTVDLTGKDIAVAIWNSKGIMYEGAASFDSTAQLIRLTINQLLQHGDFQIEFTVTDAADPDYRRKFPSGEYEGRIYIKPSTDNLDYVGVSMTTVAQFRKEFDQALNALPVDGEINLSRIATDGTIHPNLPARLSAEQQATATKLASKASEAALEIERQRISNLTAVAGNTDGNAELLDIRVGFDGITYPTAGDATRALSNYMAEDNEPWEVI